MHQDIIQMRMECSLLQKVKEQKQGMEHMQKDIKLLLKETIHMQKVVKQLHLDKIAMLKDIKQLHLDKIVILKGI